MVTTLNRLNTVTFAVDSITELVVGGQKTLHMVVPTSSFLNTDIPNKANSRDFTGEKNKSVASMIKTLRTEPDMFRVKNLGIRMVATDFTREGNKITLYFGEDEGIFNGGHTYTVLKTYGQDKAYVNVDVDLYVPKDKLVEISLSLNMSKKLEDISQGEKRGTFQWIKDTLPNEKIVYKEGDKGEYGVDEVLKVANIFKIGRNHEYAENNLFKSMRSKSAIIKENTKKQELEYTKYILPDIWDIYKKLRKSESFVKKLPKNYSTKGQLVQGLVLCFINGLRYVIKINNNNIPLWKENWDKNKAYKLCENLIPLVVKELNKAPYKDMKPEYVYRDPNFQTIMKVLFADKLT